MPATELQLKHAFMMMETGRPLTAPSAVSREDFNAVLATAKAFKKLIERNAEGAKRLWKVLRPQKGDKRDAYTAAIDRINELEARLKQ